MMNDLQYPTFTDQNGETGRTNWCNLAYAEEQPRKFKEGDMVKIKRDCSWCKAGKIYPLHYGYVSGELKDRLYAWDNTITEKEGGCNCQNNWELVEEVEQSIETQYKVIKDIDDKVKIGDTIESSHYNDLTIRLLIEGGYIEEFKKWDGGRLDYYYFIDVANEVCRERDMETNLDNERYNRGNYFPTREQAEEALKRVEKVLADYKQEIINEGN